MEHQMFCYQCQETAGGKGCKKYGVCGKSPDLAMVQDLLLYATKGLSCVTTRLREENKMVNRKTNHMITQNLFSTITNTNFEKKDLINRIESTLIVRDSLRSQVGRKNGLPEAAFWRIEDGIEKAEGLGVLATEDEDIRSLREIITYGLKGLAAYMKHANALSYEDQGVDAFIQKTLAMMLSDELSADELLNLVLKTGGYGVNGMALLDKANTERYGSPVITSVSIGARDKPGILVSGHDLRDLEMLLEQSEGTGVDIYTHSEMLPAHYYPRLKRFSHLVGNYGGSWWEQKKDFENFRGPILMTTNCVVPPGRKYENRLWTAGTVGVPGCRHIPGDYGEEKDFSPIIEQALKFTHPDAKETGSIVGGFAHAQVAAISDLLVRAISKGEIRKLVVMAGCDGRMKSRQYYTEFARKLPDDVVILTAGCAKYRYLKLDLGDVGGIPRVLDAGQCNDSYSLVQIAQKLKELLDVEDINDLPIEYNIAWYEQKAVIVLLALLSLGIRNIHLGPTLPAFISPNVLKILQESFGISGIGTVDDDLKAMVNS